MNQEERRKYMREWLTRRRDEWISEQGGACVTCGATEDLEIDHIDPAEKERAVAHLWSSTAEVRAAELAKCQVLCKQCHLAKTYA